jgi:4-amino-4-deoxy-L-arabinose transferase-like glycosyltransferase
MWRSRSIVVFSSLLCLAWIVPGLVGHDPWKPDEAYSFGLVLSFLEGHDWVVPMLGDEPFMEKPPIYYLTAALTATMFRSWLPLHDAARLASGLYMVLTFIMVGLTGRELFGKGRGWAATLMLLSCAGLLMRGHQLLTDVAQLTGFALGFYGLAVGLRRPYLGGLWLGMGVGLGFMSKGVLAPGCLGVLVIALPLLSPHWRCRDYARSVVVASLVSVPWLLIWPAMLYRESPHLFAIWLWSNNFGRFLGWNALGQAWSPGEVFVTLAWFALPAWPFALSTVWRARGELGSRPELLLPLAGFVVILSVLCLSRQGHDLYVMPALIPLSLLAVPRLLSLGPARAKAMSMAAVVLFAGLALAVWLSWAALEFSMLGALPERWAWLGPGYVPGFNVAHAALAISLVAAWVWTAVRFPAGSQRPVAIWASGITMAWGLFAILFTHYLDIGKSYRQMVADLRSRLPGEHQCIASHGLGEPQRAMLHYFAGVFTYRDERAEWRSRPCPLLLVQGSKARIYQPDGPWLKVWEGSRPGDRKELYRLYRLTDRIEGSRDRPRAERAG